MYVNPYWLGVVTVIGAEILLFVLAIIFKAIKDKK